MPIYLVRHADAGNRAQWAGDDDLRPLSSTGRRQAAHLCDLLGDRPVGRLVTSPSRRCVETLHPLAARLGLPVADAPELAEGAGGEAAVRYLLGLAGDNPVACSHGDVIPKVLRRLHAAGMRATDGNTAAKGSVWVLEVDAGAVVAGTYHPPG